MTRPYVPRPNSHKAPNSSKTDFWYSFFPCGILVASGTRYVKEQMRTSATRSMAPHYSQERWYTNIKNCFSSTSTISLQSTSICMLNTWCHMVSGYMTPALQKLTETTCKSVRPIRSKLQKQCLELLHPHEAIKLHIFISSAQNSVQNTCWILVQRQLLMLRLSKCSCSELKWHIVHFL